MSFKPVQAQRFALAGSGCASTDTSIVLASFKLPAGTLITMADFGTIGFLTIEPGTSREENISFTGVTQNVNKTATLTGVTRGLGFIQPYAETAGNKFAHAGGAVAILSNNASFYENLFPQAIKDYADGLAIAGAPDGDETTKGIYEEATQAEVNAGTATGGTGASLVVTADKLIALNASETQKGLVEEATDAEVTAGTATGATGAKLFVTPAKLATHIGGATMFGSGYSLSDTLIFSNDSTSSTVSSIVLVKVKETKITTTSVHTIRMKVDIAWNTSGVNYDVRFYLNGTQIDTQSFSRGGGSGSHTVTYNYSSVILKPDDLLQVYLNVTAFVGGTGLTASNFKLYGTFANKFLSGVGGKYITTPIITVNETSTVALSATAIS